VLAGAAGAGAFDTSIAADEDGTMTGTATAVGDQTDGTMTNFADIGAAKNKVLQVHLDKAATGGTESVLGTSSTIDPKGYLTSLNKSVIGKSEAEVGDIKRVRLLLESVIKTNPNHAP